MKQASLIFFCTLWASVALPAAVAERDAQEDAAWVKKLAAENEPGRQFHFGTVMEAASGKKVLPYDPQDPVQLRVYQAIRAALDHACAVLSRPDSPVRGQARINEVSRFFEDLLRKTLDAQPDLSATIPQTRDGRTQRSGYPDLRILHKASGKVFYLDPKLLADSSWNSSFRSFYFEPTGRNLKVNEEAVHFLAGIPHDGQVGQWTFGPAKIIDLSKIKLRLKPEFQASNADMYADPIDSPKE